jgi:tetratricopeptide (TPR) repeat protein
MRPPGFALCLVLGCLAPLGAQEDTAAKLARAGELSATADRLRDEGKFTEAIPLVQEVLQITEQLRGPEHPDVALCADNLAGSYLDSGRYAEAEALYRRAVAIAEKTLGPAHPRVAGVLGNLAHLLARKGDWAASLELTL